MKIKGKILDAHSGEPLAYANVYISDREGNVTKASKGTTTTINGDFNINADKSDYITSSYIGYPRDTFQVADLSCTKSSCEVTRKLKPAAVGIEEVEIIAKRPKKKYNWLIPLAIGGTIAGLTLLGISIYKIAKK